jgi:hypothetical protein
MRISAGLALASCSLFRLLQASQVPDGNHNPVVTEESKYCLGNPGPVILAAEAGQPNAVMLVLRLRVFYRNVAAVPLILPIYHEVSELIIRPTPAHSGPRYIVPFSRLQAPTDELPGDINMEEPFNPWFKVIPPGAVLEKYFTENVVVGVHDPGSQGHKQELLGKTILMQLQLAHLGLSRPLENQVADKWKRYGYLLEGQSDIETN